MFKGMNSLHWWHRTPIALKVGSLAVLVLLISSVFFSNSFLAHAADGNQSHLWNNKPLNLKKAEGDWFQLSHFGKHLPAPDARIKAIGQAKLLMQATSDPSASWSALGPKPLDSSPVSTDGLVSGRVTALAVNPTNSNEIWLGAADGGVWHSTDGGLSWFPLTDLQATLSIGAITVDPTNPNIIYVGTGEANFNADAYWGVGVLKSIDDGAHWTTVGFTQFAGMSISRIAVDPANSNIVLLAASPNAFPGPNGTTNSSTNPGIWRSTDKGHTWTQVISGGNGNDVVFNPATPSTAFAVLGNSSSAGVYESTDSGATWTLLSSGIPTGSAIFRGVVGISADGTHLYAAFAESTPSFGTMLNGSVYVSTDGGATWTAKAVPAGLANSNTQLWYDIYAQVDRTDSTGNTAYVGGIDVWQTTDGGTTWTNTTNAYSGGIVHPDQHALVFKPGSSSYYIGNDGGIWSGTPVSPGTVTYTDLNAGTGTAVLNTNQAYGVSIGEKGTFSRLYAGLQDNGEAQYPGDPNSRLTVPWKEVFTGDGGFTAVDYTNNANVYEEYVHLAIHKSTDGGSTWSTATSGINPSDPTNFIAPFVISPNNASELFAGTDRVYRTTDGATSWTAISPSLSGAPLSIITVARGNDKVIMAGDNNGNVFVTTNGGASWSGGAIAGSTGCMVRGVAVSASSFSTLYASFACFAPGTGEHVFKSTNSGASWSDISASLPNIPFSSILTLPGHVVVGSDVGVFDSTDGGTTWHNISFALPNVALDQMSDNYSQNRLYVATHGRGVWAYTIA